VFQVCSKRVPNTDIPSVFLCSTPYRGNTGNTGESGEENSKACSNWKPLKPCYDHRMEESWKWYTRKHNNAPVFALLFNGQNHADVARIPGVTIDADMFAGIRFSQPPHNIPQFASSGDYIAWEDGHASVWNRTSFLFAHTLGKPKGRRLGSKDAGGQVQS